MTDRDNSKIFTLIGIGLLILTSVVIIIASGVTSARSIQHNSEWTFHEREDGSFVCTVNAPYPGKLDVEGSAHYSTGFGYAPPWNEVERDPLIGCTVRDSKGAIIGEQISNTRSFDERYELRKKGTYTITITLNSDASGKSVSARYTSKYIPFSCLSMCCLGPMLFGIGIVLMIYTLTPKKKIPEPKYY